MIKKYVLAATIILAAHAAIAAPPIAKIIPFVTDYYGTKVTDDYRWMETPNSPALATYMKGQNDYTRMKLDSIPGRAKLYKEILAEDDAGSFIETLILAGGRQFYTEEAPGQNSAKLYLRDPATGVKTLLVDPDKFGKSAEAINFFQPSLDGKYVAYGVSAGGSEADTLRVIDTATLKDQGVAIDRVDGDNFEFLPVWWLPDDSLAYYRLQKLRPSDPASAFYLKSRVFLHHLGKNPTGEGDVPLFGYAVDKSVPVAADQDALVMSFPGCGYAFGVLTENESSNVIDAIYVSKMSDVEAGAPVWKPLAAKSDNITQFDAAGDKLFLLTYKNAPRYKIISTNLASPGLASAATVVPQGDGVITQLTVAKDALYVDISADGYGKISHLPLGGGAETTMALPYQGSVGGLVTNETAGGVIFPLESWTRSSVWFGYDPATMKITDTGLKKPLASPVKLVSEEVTATSYDGTPVPLSIVMAAGTKLDGKNPTLLEGYGSYGITLTPGFDPLALPWFARGGIYAVAHVRGGGWYGEDWHKAGQKLTKLNTVFDFIACARYLEDHKYTSPAYLAGEGGSAGGITIGGAITWAPDVFAAAIDSHGDTDSLRMEFTPNGPPNIEEFGSVTTVDGFHGLYAMSAYVHVRNGVEYPAVLLETGANDPRVAPWAVTKMAARLQAASASGKPILLSVDYDSGHGIGDTKAQESATFADEFAFMLWQFGVPGYQPAK